MFCNEEREKRMWEVEEFRDFVQSVSKEHNIPGHIIAHLIFNEVEALRVNSILKGRRYETLVKMEVANCRRWLKEPFRGGN